MERTPEPDLMNDVEQVHAYAHADFTEPHDHFVGLFRERFATLRPERILDLGTSRTPFTRPTGRRKFDGNSPRPASHTSRSKP